MSGATSGGTRSDEGTHVFSKEIAAQVRRIELRTRGLVESMFSGEYHSVFHGRGLEFSDVREYQPGDDVRAIDWNVTARRGRLFVKEYVEERELTAVVVVDLSASKSFGTGEKPNAVIASEIAAILAFAAVANNDRVGLVLVAEDVELFLPPGSGRRHALRLVMELLSFRPARRGTRLSAGLQYASKVLHRRAAVFVVSDFLFDAESDPHFAREARRLARDHDLVPVRLTDPLGAELPDVGLLTVVDPETGERNVIDTSSLAKRARYGTERAAQQAVISALFRDLGVGVVEVTTTEDYVPPLIRFFRQRERAGR